MAPATLRLPAQLANLELAQAHVASAAVRCGVDEPQRGRVALAFEEVFVNVCRYAKTGREGSVEVTCLGDGGQFVVEVSDEGEPFDPTALPEPNLAANIAERRIGGLGWFLVRRLAERVDYRRRDGCNVVRLSFNLAAGGAA